MDRRQFLDITEGFDNIQYIDMPCYMHFWIDNNNKLQSRAGDTQFRKFRGDARMMLIEYLEAEHAKGHTVYFYGDPVTFYDPHDFSQIVTFRMNSYDGRLMNKKDEEVVSR
jgi:hypothetical protein